MKRWFMLFECIVFCMILLAGCGGTSTDPGDDNTDNNTLQFDGTDDYVDCGNDVSVNITEMITVAAWIKGDSETNSFARILDKYNHVARTGYNLARAPWVNSVFLEFHSNDGSHHQCTAETPVFDDNWHHVTATYDGNAMKIYIDGILENENVIGKVNIQICSDNLIIGNGFDGNVWFPFMGCIDELSLWNTAIDSLQIQAIMTDTFPIQNGSLVAYYRFDMLEDLGISEDGTDDIRDLSVYGNHGDINGNPLLVTSKN